MVKILFLDLDGTVRQSKSGATFINDPEDQELIEGAAGAIAYYKSRGWLIIGITNQGGVAANKKSLENATREQNITLISADLDLIYFCPDYEGLECWKVSPSSGTKLILETKLIKQRSIEEFGSFRKPGPGMLNLALKYLEKTASDCWMVGDRPEDKEAALAAGVNFCPADVWRNRFLPGVREFHGLTPEQIKFLEGID